MPQTKTSKARSSAARSSAKKSGAKTGRKSASSARKSSRMKSSVSRPRGQGRSGNAAMLKKAHAIAKREQKLRPRTPYNKLVGEAMKSLAK